uniref:transposase n=1 Tax=Flavobacterium weaverense TaxID=271156 RepID=UPI0021D1A07F|nr:transposase [Flavobacterium weaverense]
MLNFSTYVFLYAGHVRNSVTQQSSSRQPLGSPKSVVECLGRYTHKIAVSNNQIQSLDDQNVTFCYKDYHQNGFKKKMTLTHAEFIRRFTLHILP